jgi:sugar lactone lactonase YvrE
VNGLKHLRCFKPNSRILFFSLKRHKSVVNCCIATNRSIKIDINQFSIKISMNQLCSTQVDTNQSGYRSGQLVRSADQLTLRPTGRYRLPRHPSMPMLVGPSLNISAYASTTQGHPVCFHKSLQP